GRHHVRLAVLAIVPIISLDSTIPSRVFCPVTLGCVNDGFPKVCGAVLDDVTGDFNTKPKSF
ncbi:MAG: hypothetical protein R6U98_18300, partial [Pirellulaceae bacterium]